MIANCPDKFKKLVPLSKVVNASLIDLYEDIGKMQQLTFHWAAREFRLMQTQILKGGIRRALITVNQNTRTASLPPDFDSELFVGYIRHGKKISIPLRTNLINDNSITTIECEDTCAKCGQDATICNDLTVTESEELVVVNESTYVKTTIKKLYPDGSYFLETTIPYWDVANNVIAYATTKEFIAKIDLKDCGCINPTVENIETIRDCCFDCWCSHFAPCDGVCDNDCGGYKIFEETGFIQFDWKFRHRQVYLEYRGYIPKLNGQLAVPEVSFEALVEATKFRIIEGKRNVSNADKKFRFDMKSIARKNMIKVMARVSLDDIIYIVSLTPKFNWTAPAWNDFCPVPENNTVTITNSNVCDSTATLCHANGTIPVLTPFQIAVTVPATETDGLPVPGATTYQLEVLKNALNLEYIIVNDANESRKLLKFTFDSATGTIDRSPNIWFAGDVLIANFNKMV